MKCKQLIQVVTDLQFFFCVRVLFHLICFLLCYLLEMANKEFNQVLQSDSCRLLQLHCHTASPDHPFNRFYWGTCVSAVNNSLIMTWGSMLW